jgi:hypothetical protein
MAVFIHVFWKVVIGADTSNKSTSGVTVMVPLAGTEGQPPIVVMIKLKIPELSAVPLIVKTPLMALKEPLIPKGNPPEVIEALVAPFPI